MMCHKRMLIPGLVLMGLLLPARGVAQMPSLESPTGVNASFIKLFGTHKTFASKVEAQVFDASGKEWVSLELEMKALDEKVRLDIDLDRIKSRDLPEFAVASLKQAGLGRVISLILPDKKATYVIYPAAEAVLDLPLEQKDAEALAAGYQVEKTELGQEAVESEPCVKNKVVVRNKGAVALEATTWEAASLKGFPVKIETKEKSRTMVMRFRQVQFTRPDAALFELPKGYTQYKDPQAMMVGLMKKIASGAAGDSEK